MGTKRFRLHAERRDHIDALRAELGANAVEWNVRDGAVVEASFATTLKANEIRSAAEHARADALMLDTLAIDFLFTGERHAERVQRAYDILGDRWGISDEVKWDEDGFGHRLAADRGAIAVLEQLRDRRTLVESILIDTPRRLLFVLESDCPRARSVNAPPEELEGEPLADGLVLLYGDRALAVLRFDFDTEASKHQLMPTAPRTSVYYVTSRGRGCFTLDGAPR